MNDPDPPVGSTHVPHADPEPAAAADATGTGSAFTVAPSPRGIPAPVQAAVLAVRSGARWFWWIAGLSAVNTGMSLAHADTQFVLGLGITAVADAVFRNAQVIGLVIDALVVGYFWWIGLQAQRGKRWAFVAGLAVYVPDTLIYLYVQDWMPVGFHALAVYFIVRGLRALSALQPAVAAA